MSVTEARFAPPEPDSDPTPPPSDVARDPERLLVWNAHQGGATAGDGKYSRIRASNANNSDLVEGCGATSPYYCGRCAGSGCPSQWVCHGTSVGEIQTMTGRKLLNSSATADEEPATPIAPDARR